MKRTDVLPVLSLIVFVIAATFCLMVLAGGANALAEYPPSIGRAAGLGLEDH